MGACYLSVQQVESSWGVKRAAAVEVGGGIRRYEVEDGSGLDTYPADAMCDGALLLPWPNRPADGRYRFDGVGYQAALTEPEKRNDIHGCLHWRPWQVPRQTEDEVTMGARVFWVEGDPFTLDGEVDYALDEAGLTVATTAANAGQHPYPSAGPGLVDDCSLRLDGTTPILTANERQLPAGTEAVAGTPYSLREDRVPGNQPLDFAETAPIEEPEFYRCDVDTTAVTEVWRESSVVDSWLSDLTAAALFASPALEEFAGRVSDSGERRWTSTAAVDEGVPSPVLTPALSSRAIDDFADKVLSAMRKCFGGHDEKTT